MEPRTHRAPLQALSIAMLIGVLLFQAAPVQAAPASAPEYRFGAVEAFRARGQADSAGVRWSRLVFWWSGVQPSGPESWNPFFFPDDLLQAELASGRQVVGLLINTPAWAGDGSPNSVPRNLELPVTDPRNHWAAFARKMAERYRGRIDHWVIWNEPDIWDAASPLHTWAGTVEQFYQLQKVAYQAIKRGNPAATVALPGLTYHWDYQYDRPQYFERYLEVAAGDPSAAANNWYFDAAVLHLYNEPEGLYRAPTLYRDLMSARGLRKPIWINETNVAPWDDPTNPLPRADFRATLDEQASYLIQAFAYGLAAGADRISVYPFADGDSPPGWELMGLVRGDGSTRPAYQAFRTISSYLSGVREGQVQRTGDAVRISLRRQDSLVTAVWAASSRPTAVQISATAPRALLVDKYGQTAQLEARDGAYRLELDGATANTVNGTPQVYLIGGNPLLLVESSQPEPGR